jgi:hypothetical protein
MPPEEMIRRGLERLQEAMASGDEVACRSVLADLVPESKLRTRGTDTGRTKIVSAQRT